MPPRTIGGVNEPTGRMPLFELTAEPEVLPHSPESSLQHPTPPVDPTGVTSAVPPSCFSEFVRSFPWRTSSAH